MRNFDAIKALIRAISGQENVIAVPRAYCDFMGDLDGGAFLSQLIYFSDRGSDPDGWFYKSYADWEQHLLLSKHKVMRCAQQMRAAGYLETRVRKVRGVPKLHYRLDMERFAAALSAYLETRNLNTQGAPKVESSTMESQKTESPKVENLTMESQKMESPLKTEITTQTTTQIKDADAANAARARQEYERMVNLLDEFFGARENAPELAPAETIDWTHPAARAAAIEAATARWAAAQAAAPWLAFGQNCPTIRDYQPGLGVDKGLVLRIIATLVEEYSVPFTRNKPATVRHWLTSAEQLAAAANGAWEVCERAIAYHVRAGLSIKSPASVMHAVGTIQRQEKTHAVSNQRPSATQAARDRAAAERLRARGIII